MSAIEINLPLEELATVVRYEVCEAFASLARDEWFTVQEAAEYVRCSVRTIRSLIRLGEVPAHKVNGTAKNERWLLSRRELDFWVRGGATRD